MVGGESVVGGKRVVGGERVGGGERVREAVLSIPNSLLPS